jgi:hypothetical protein
LARSCGEVCLHGSIRTFLETATGLKGSFLAIGAWILMMVLLMPMAGAGFFGINFGAMAPFMTFVLHIIFGAVLGGVYGLERPELAPHLQFSRRT